MPLNKLALYYCPPYEKVICTQEEITNAKESRWKTFDQYKKRNFAVWITTLPQDQAKWKDSVCTCPAFSRIIYASTSWAWLFDAKTLNLLLLLKKYQ